MRIGLYSGSTLYPLAGTAGTSIRAHSPAADFELSPESEMEVAKYILAEYAKPIDRGNLLNVLRFTTTRLFATPAEAQLWCMDYHSAFPSSGTLYVDAIAPDGTVTRRTMENTVVDPPSRRCNGATAMLDYIARGGIIAAGTAPVRASVTINPTGADNSALYTATDVGTWGNGVTMQYAISGTGSTVLSVAVTGLAILVTAGSACTAASVIAAVNADASASALVTAAASGTVTGAIVAVAATNLTGGTD